MKERSCKKCGKKFKPTVWNQVYCGSKTKKIGCSWANANIDRSRRRWRNSKSYQEFQKEYNKEWKKEQRGKNTPYAQRQRELKRKYSKSAQGKTQAARWRKKNIKKILAWNRQRILQKRGVIGFHSEAEWGELKKKYNYRCAQCGIPEKKLKEIWEETSFTKLTKDHIIPVDKGGTDFINNIQPLCVSCNAKKHSKILRQDKEVVVAVSGYFNPIHVGHIRLFEEAKKLGTKLIVIINNDRQVKLKGSFPFMTEKERAEIIASLAPVDNVIVAIDEDKSVCKTLELIRPDIFANGGDRTEKNIPEVEVCKKINCKLVFNVGHGGKIQSSSWLLTKYANGLQSKTYRPWGYFTVIEEGENFKVKKVVVEPKQKLSLQLHKKRSEHWVVLKGKARVKLNNKIFNLKPHQSIDIPVGSKHRLENPTNKPLEIIEVQNGDYLEEDDIIRFKDKYGRGKIRN